MLCQSNRQTLRLLLVGSLLGLFVASGIFASSAFAASSGHDEASDGEPKGPAAVDPEGAAPSHSIAMPMLLVPVVVDGKKSHYIFLTYRLVVDSELQVDRVNQKVAWLHDAFMRDVFKTSPVNPEDPNRIDRRYLEERFQALGRKVIGADLIKGIYYQIELSEHDPRKPIIPLRPSPEADTGGEITH